MEGVCKTEDCNKDCYAKGLCQTCYNRARYRYNKDKEARAKADMDRLWRGDPKPDATSLVKPKARRLVKRTAKRLRYMTTEQQAEIALRVARRIKRR